MKKLSKVLVSVCVMAVALVAMAGCGSKSGSADTIKFGTNAEFPPFEFISAKGVIGEYDGIDIAIAKKIGEELGKEATIENMEFDSLLVALQNGQIDAVIAGMTVTDERKEAVNFSTPYYTATQVMIVKEDSDIAKATDMEGKTIAVVQGYTGETCVQEMGYDYEAFKKDVSDNKGIKIVEDSSAFESEEYAIAIQKGNDELLEKVNAAVEKFLADGTISELAAQYAQAE